ncbi:hypothetical protein PUMCH_000057 [Australozyma saopauloensis]|uniref:Uncharacterized protein n=1 Tax=Australozyma saopauloensis TaxID=291208 RepID=A0AAX4H3R8_9ASCO|nr:hypothetical protein PUMCH_000057 [[Candida] saopauloensis]
MAFNPTFEAKRKLSARAPSVEKEVSLFSESQNSWVVFNPNDQVPYDILSFSTNNPLTSSDEEDQEEEDDEVHLKYDIRQEDPHDMSEEHEDDDLIEDLHTSLSNRINEWQKTTDTSVSDNVASWDLDAELVSQMLDTTILQRVPAFYGDKYFDGMSKSQYTEFKRTSARLRRSLTRGGINSSDPDLLTRLLSLLQWQSLLRDSSSGSMVNDYIVNTRSRVHHRRPKFVRQYSDTATSSSLVMCGGPSWNDV